MYYININIDIHSLSETLNNAFLEIQKTTNLLINILDLENGDQ